MHKEEMKHHERKMHSREMQHDGYEKHSERHKYSDSKMKPDETGHKKNEDMGTMAKKAKLPGQMYVPAHCHNESDFAGEER